MALEFPSELIMTDTDFSYSVLGQIFLQQVCASPRLLVQLQSNCIIIILLYIFNSFTNDLIIVLIGVFFIVSGCLNIVELFDISKREKREERIINSLNKSIDNDVDHIDIDFTKDKKD